MLGANALGWVYLGEAFLPSGILKSGSDTGTISESAAVKAVITAQDPSLSTYAAMTASFATYAAIPAEVSTYAQLLYAPYPTATETGTVKVMPVVLDSNSTTSEISTIKAVLSGADANGYAELATPKAVLSASDANSTTTETSKAGILFTVTDTNGYAETAFLGQISLTTADSIITVEGASVFYSSFPVSASDSANGFDAALLLAQLIVSDANGISTETALTPQQWYTATDANGVTSELLALGITLADSGTGTENFRFIFSTTDFNGGVIEIAATGFRVVDANGATGEQITGIEIRVSDSGSVSSEIPFFRLYANDDATSIESRLLAAGISTLDASLIVEEEAGFNSRLDVTADISSGIDSASLAANLKGGDQGTESESSALRASYEVTDGATDSESAGISRVGVTSSDLGGDFESALIRAIIGVADQGTSSEISVFSLLASDFGSSTQVQSLQARLSDSDQAHDSENGNVGRLLPVGDIRWILEAGSKEIPVLLAVETNG